ncbi:hypothetical protein HDU87_008856 [Geranomyces variabilis]|uniref:Rho-GAP domain-containing protein n=1 Tax=Geranomyces variabilis TaxID=109894 RepID=A0AAD5XLV7_9FUNG|nr:hypothetical protein HDU87_008856 [Geranomyces variabilis]
MLRFDDCFWGTGEDPAAGVRALHAVFTQHLAEADDLLALVRARVVSEETYASNFLELGRHSGSVAAPATLSLASAFSSSASSSSPSFSRDPTRRYSRASTPAIAAGTMTGLTTGDHNRITLNNIAQGLGNAAAKLQSAAAQSGLPGTSSWCLTTEPDSFNNGDRSIGNGTSSSSNLSTSTVGPIDDESSVRPVIRTIREQMVAMAAAHRRHADTLTMAVISPLQAFVEQHRKVMTKKKSEVDLNHQQLARLAADIGARHAVYIQKCKIAEEEDFKFRQDGESRASRIAPGPVMIGSRSVGPNEFQTIVETMRKEVKTKSIMTDLGLFEGCFMGEDALDHLRKRYPGIPRADLRLICREILARRLMAPLIGPNDGSFDPELPYQFGRPLLKSGEPPHVKARKDSEMARLDYDSAIKSAEHTRSALEFHITDYLLAAQEAERYRLKVIQEAVLALETAQVFLVSELQTTWRPPALVDSVNDSAAAEGAAHPATLLTSPNPEEGVQYIARRYRTGHLRSKPFVFESYKNGRAPHQVFGIGLEELSKVTKTPIPPIVRRCVSALYESLVAGRSTIDTWIVPNPDLPSVQFLRMEFNASPRCGRVTATTLKRYQPQVHAGVLKLYLVEAPVSLCSYDTYETLRMLYSDDFQKVDDDVRVKSVKSLLSTLSPPHYETLRFFTAYLHELVKPLAEDDDRIIRLAYSIGPCILRPTNETTETLQDQHPWRFSLELMVRHPEFFGPVDKAALMAEITMPPSPEPEDDGEHGDGGGQGIGGRNGNLTPALRSESTPPGTPPLREPVGNKQQGSWFPWPLTGTTAQQSPQPSPSESVSPTDENSSLQPQTDKSVKAARRVSRLEDRLAGVLAKAKGSVPVPTSDVDLEDDAPRTPVNELANTVEAEAAASGGDNPWTALKGFLGQKKPSNASLSSTSSTSTQKADPASRAAAAASPTATPPAAAVTAAATQRDAAYDSPEYIAAREVIVERNNKPSIYRSASVASVAGLAKSFLGSVVARASAASPKDEPLLGRMSPLAYTTTSVTPASPSSPSAAPEVIPAAPASADLTMVPVESTTFSPYEDVINADHPAEAEIPIAFHETALALQEEVMEEEEEEETESLYEDGEEEYEEEYAEGESEYAEGESEYAETEAEYEEAEEVVVVEEGAEGEEEARQAGEPGGEEEVQAHVFPASAQEMSEYLQWG